MNDERDQTVDGDAQDDSESQQEDVGTTSETPPIDDEERRKAKTSDDFLVPGPSPQSNEGLRRWGLTWLAFSLMLIVLMLCVSFACLTLANWTGVA